MQSPKKSHAERTPASGEQEAGEEDILRAHVAKLVKAGRVLPGKHGPPLGLILRPGPRYPNASRAVTLDRRGR